MSLSRPTDLTIEWLRLRSRGELSVDAMWQFPLALRVPLPISLDPDRFVRFSRPGASPVTFRASDFFRENWKLPDPVPGGELLKGVEAASVMPVLYRVTGSAWSANVVPDARAVISVPGVPEGSYLLSPIYEGGVSGRSLSFEISMSGSTVLAMEKEDVGAVRFTLDDRACRITAASRSFGSPQVSRAAAAGTVTTTTGRTFVRLSMAVKPGDTPPFVLRGLGFGAYSVRCGPLGEDRAVARDARLGGWPTLIARSAHH